MQEEQHVQLLNGNDKMSFFHREIKAEILRNVYGT